MTYVPKPRTPYSWSDLGKEYQARAAAKGLGKVPGERHVWLLGDAGEEADPIRARLPAMEYYPDYFADLAAWKKAGGDDQPEEENS